MEGDGRLIHLTGLKQVRNIFTPFFRIELFTFGAGYAMISLIEKENDNICHP